MGAQLVAEAAGAAGVGGAGGGGGRMSAHQTRTVEVLGRRCRVSEKGEGRPLYYLPSSVLSLKWSPFHEALAARARLCACHLPGFGGGDGHDGIDDHLGWCLAARDLLLAAGFRPGDALVAASATGAVAADVAALWPDLVGRLVLIAPFGLYDMSEPTRDVFAVQAREAPALFCENAHAYESQLQPPEGEEALAWSILVGRAQEAAARILWPFGDTRLKERLHRIAAPTLLLWGQADKVVPAAYAGRFAGGMRAKVSTAMIAGGGHLVELDRPQETAAAVLSFVN
jgi:pimeloyl-ACP methyl ester carboxylesterase